MTRPPIFESYSNELPPPGRDALPVSIPAAFGLAASLLQCLPVISGVGAVVLGYIGLREIRRRERIGRPLALAAIALGTISIVVWVVVLGTGTVLGLRLASAVQMSSRFASAAANGDEAALREMTHSDIPDEQIAAWVAAVHEPGATPNVVMDGLTTQETQLDSLVQLWRGPYIVTQRLTYSAAPEQEPAASRRIDLTLRRIDGTMRVVEAEVRRSAVQRMSSSPATRAATAPATRRDEAGDTIDDGPG